MGPRASRLPSAFPLSSLMTCCSGMGLPPGGGFLFLQETLLSVSKVTAHSSVLRPWPAAVAAHSLVCAGKVYQDKSCSAYNCSDGLVDFEVHVSDEERFHFESECCQGDSCKNASDGGCWPAPQVHLFFNSTSPFALVLRSQ